MKKNITDRHYEKSSNWWKKSSFFLFQRNPVNESHDFFKWFFMCVCANPTGNDVTDTWIFVSWVRKNWHHGYIIFGIMDTIYLVSKFWPSMFIWYHFYVSNLCHHRLAICYRVSFVWSKYNSKWGFICQIFECVSLHVFFNYYSGWIQLNFTMDYWEIQISFESYSIWNITWSIYNKYKKKNHCFDSFELLIFTSKVD